MWLQRDKPTTTARCCGGGFTFKRTLTTNTRNNHTSLRKNKERMAVEQNTIYGLYVKCPWCADDGECIVMVHVHCRCQKVRGENNVGRNLGRQSRMGKTNGQSAHACSQNFKRVIQKAGVIIFILTRNFLLKRKKTKI